MSPALAATLNILAPGAQNWDNEFRDSMQPSQLRQAVSERISLRQATLEDARTIAKHRRLMFRDMGYADEAALDAIDGEIPALA